MSIARSAAPSAFGHDGTASAFVDSVAARFPAAPDLHLLQVRVMNGVNAEEEFRFDLDVKNVFNQQQLLASLDSQCQKSGGLCLLDLNWMRPSSAGRYERRPCDMRMVEETMPGGVLNPNGPPLLLCSIPQRPPSELIAMQGVQLKKLTPDILRLDRPAPSSFKLSTNALQEGHHYSVAFVHQTTFTTYYADATLLPNKKGVELPPPRKILQQTASGTVEGLYDVHLVIDQRYRSENRRTLSIDITDSELSSATCVSAKFVPVPRV
jgi:hypothetical protein